VFWLGKEFSLLGIVQTSSGAYSASYPMRTKCHTKHDFHDAFKKIAEMLGTVHMCRMGLLQW
jgi:hypothetical protein